MRRYKTLIAIAILLRFVVQEFVQEWVQICIRVSDCNLTGNARACERLVFHGPFLRSAKYSLQNRANLRIATRMGFDRTA